MVHMQYVLNRNSSVARIPNGGGVLYSGPQKFSFYKAKIKDLGRMGGHPLQLPPLQLRYCHCLPPMLEQTYKVCKIIRKEEKATAQGYLKGKITILCSPEIPLQFAPRHSYSRNGTTCASYPQLQFASHSYKYPNVG